MKTGWGGRRPGAGRKRGSKNPNAGRKPGSLNRLTKVVLAECNRTGELWHEVLLRMSRGERIGDYQPTLQDILRAAKAAAPYYHTQLRVRVLPPVDADTAIDELAKLVAKGA